MTFIFRMLGASSSEESDDGEAEAESYVPDALSLPNRKPSERSTSPPDSDQHSIMSGSIRGVPITEVPPASMANHHTPIPSSPSLSSYSDRRIERVQAQDSTERKVSSEEQEKMKAEQEEEDRKTRLQVYVFVARCITYHFNAKQPTDMARRFEFF